MLENAPTVSFLNVYIIDVNVTKVDNCPLHGSFTTNPILYIHKLHIHRILAHLSCICVLQLSCSYNLYLLGILERVPKLKWIQPNINIRNIVDTLQQYKKAERTFQFHYNFSFWHLHTLQNRLVVSGYVRAQFVHAKLELGNTRLLLGRRRKGS